MNAAAVRAQQDGVPPPNSLAYHSRVRVLWIPAEVCLLHGHSSSTQSALQSPAAGAQYASKSPLAKSPLFSPHLSTPNGRPGNAILIRQSGFEKRLHTVMVERHIVPMKRLQKAFPAASENYHEDADLNISFELALNPLPSRWENLRIHERVAAVVVVLNCNYLDQSAPQPSGSRTQPTSTRLAVPIQPSAFEDTSSATSGSAVPGGVRWPDAVRCVTAVKKFFHAYFKRVPCRCVVIDPPSSLRSLLTPNIFINVSSKSDVDAFGSSLVHNIAGAIVHSLNAQIAALTTPSNDLSTYVTPLDDPDAFAAQSTIFNSSSNTISVTGPTASLSRPTSTSATPVPPATTAATTNNATASSVTPPPPSNTNRSSATSNSAGSAASGESARRVNISARLVKQRADILLQLGGIDAALQLQGSTPFTGDPLWVAALLNSIAAARYAHNRVFVAFIQDAGRIFSVFLSDATRWGPDLAPLVEALQSVVGNTMAALKRSVARMRSAVVTSSVKNHLVREIDEPSQKNWTELQEHLTVLKEGTSSSGASPTLDTIDYALLERLVTASTEAKRCFEVISRLVFAELDIYLSEALNQLQSIPRRLYDLEAKIQLEKAVLCALQGNKQKLLSSFLPLRATVNKLPENDSHAPLRYVPLLCNACGCKRKAALFMVESAIAERRARNYEGAVFLLVQTALLIGIPLDIPQLLSVVGLPYPPPARPNTDSLRELVGGAASRDSSQREFLCALGERAFTSFPVIRNARRALDACDTAAAKKRQAENSNASSSSNNNSSGSNGAINGMQGSEHGGASGTQQILRSSHVSVLLELLGVLTEANWTADGVCCHLASLLLFSYASLLDSNTQQGLLRIMDQDASLLLPHVPPVHRLPSLFTNVDVLPLPPHLAPKIVHVSGARFLFIDLKQLKTTVLSMNGRKLDDSVVWCAGEVGTVRVTVANPFLNYLQITSIALLCRKIDIPKDDTASAAPVVQQHADPERPGDSKEVLTRESTTVVSTFANNRSANSTFFIGCDDKDEIVSRLPSKADFRDGDNDTNRMTAQNSAAISNDIDITSGSSNSSSDTDSDVGDGGCDTSNYYGCSTSYSSTGEETPISYLTKGIVLEPQVTTQLSLFVEPRKEGFLSIDGIEVRVGQLSQCAPVIVHFPKPYLVPVIRKLPTIECIMSNNDVEIFGGQTFHLSARLINNSMVPISKMRFSVHSSACQLDGCEGCLERVSTKEVYAHVEKLSGDGSDAGEADPSASASGAAAPVSVPWVRDEKDTNTLYAFQPLATATFDVTLTAPMSAPAVALSLIVFRVDYGVDYEKPKPPPGVGSSTPVYGVVPQRSSETKIRLLHLPSLEISSLSLSKDRRFVEVRVKNRNPRSTIVLLAASVLSFAGIGDMSLACRSEYPLAPIEISKIPEGKRSFAIPWALRDSPKCRGTVTLDLSKLQNEVVYADPLEDAVVCVVCELDGTVLHNWLNTNPPLFPLCFPAVRPVQVTVMITAPWRTAIPLRVRVSTDPLADVSMIAGPTDTTVVVGQHDADYREVFELIAFKTGEHVITVTLADSKQREITHTIRLQVEHTQT